MTPLECRAAATPRVSVKRGRLFWQPSAPMRRRGWKGKALGPLSVEALNAADQLNAEAHDHAQPTSRGTVAAAAERYLAGLEVAAKTERHYRRHLRLLAERFGALAVSELDRTRLQTWHDELAASGPREAANTVASVRVWLSWCYEEGMIGALPRRVRTRAKRRRRRIASRDELWALINSADALGRPSIAVATILLVTTMQREADVLALDTDRIEDNALLPLHQQKTDELVGFMLHPVALERIMPLPAVNAPRPLVMSEITCDRYTERTFQHVFAAVRAHAAKAMPSLEGADASVRDPNLKGRLYAGDLRRTGMVWAAQSGAGVAEIVSVSGHSIARGTAILEHYLPRDRVLADRAVARLNLHRTPD